MKLIIRFGLLLLLVVGASILEFGSSNIKEHSLITTADAIVGRPLSPVSVAGVARRTGRRCATGVYNCR